jgi:hypothetical protein
MPAVDLPLAQAPAELDMAALMPPLGKVAEPLELLAVPDPPTDPPTDPKIEEIPEGAEPPPAPLPGNPLLDTSTCVMWETAHAVAVTWWSTKKYVPTALSPRTGVVGVAWIEMIPAHALVDGSYVVRTTDCPELPTPELTSLVLRWMAPGASHLRPVSMCWTLFGDGLVRPANDWLLVA